MFLGDLPPKLGTSNVTQVLPHGLEGRYSRPLVVACPTDPATDRVRDVTYSLAKRYIGFHATLHGFNPTPDESLVQVTLFLDKQDGRAFRFAIGQPQDVDIDVDVTDVDDLRIEVGCQNPSAFGDNVVKLYNNQLTRAYGLRADDPVWADVRGTVQYFDGRQNGRDVVSPTPPLQGRVD